MAFDQIDKFSSRFKKQYFRAKDGFHEVPYLANSPESMIESFKTLPYMNWDENKKLMVTQNPFVTGNFFWHKLEDGLWFVKSDLHYQSNVSYKFVYDKNLPATYYLLSFNIFSHNTISKVAIVNGLSYNTFSWNVFKPMANVMHFNFKNTGLSSLCLYFSEEWANKNLLCDENFKKSKFCTYFKSKGTSMIIWPELESKAVFFFEKANALLTKTQEKEKIQSLKNLAMDFMGHFTKNYNIEHSNDDALEINNETQIKLIKVEKILNDNLFKEFPGIDFLAAKFGMSQTKLKNNFKKLYGESIYQYYLGKQMDYAKTLISQRNMKISEVSYLLGYKNNTKFAKAFKRRHSVLPSKINITVT